MFDLKRPCVDCPFRIGQGERYQLHADRIRDITRATGFQCHRTCDYNSDVIQGTKPQQCAGLMAILHRENRPNQMMQIAQRLKVTNPDELDRKGEAYASLADALEAHAR